MIRLFVVAMVAQTQGAIPTWTLSPSPTLTIADDGTPATQFVRVMGVMRLSNGGVAIANRGTNDVRIFDARLVTDRSGSVIREATHSWWSGRVTCRASPSTCLSPPGRRAGI
jgi:hypothetical protein